MNKIKFPENAKEGDIFSYIEPIGGASWVFFLRVMEEWEFWKVE